MVNKSNLINIFGALFIVTYFHCACLAHSFQKRDVTCLPRISSSVDIICKLDGTAVNCSQPLVEGTVATSKCKQFYTMAQNDIPISRCSGGSWDVPLIRCVPECGKRVNIDKEEIANAREFPWHVALYHLREEKYEYLCGGSIITPVIILTVAHCITEGSESVQHPAEEYYVAAGKDYRDYNAENNILVQKRQVKEFHIPPGYRGQKLNYAGDIALLVIKNAFQMSNVVQPVCVDYANALEAKQLKSNNKGTVVGYGQFFSGSNDTNPSEELKALDVPYIDVGQCLDDVSDTFQRYVTPDKFCAGFTNGTGVCKGNGGGGLVFGWEENKEQKFYIRGVLSTGQIKKGKCDYYSYALYTKVSHYIDFILNIVATNPVID